MIIAQQATAAHSLAWAPTALFVMLWSAGALFARWGLDHASPLLFLVLRFGLALAVLLPLGLYRGRCWPSEGSRAGVAAAGFLMVGTYSVCYHLALGKGLTPGVLATVLGVQPVLTLLLTRDQASPARVAGLALAITGLVLVVFDSLANARFSVAGVLFAMGALASITLGAVLQKRVVDEPSRVLPLQYAISLALCAALLPLEPLYVEPGWGLAGSLFAMGILISVAGSLLLYRLIQAGNLVNVTSLFYVVPPGTALLDALLLGNRMSPLALAGLGVILAGLAMVFRRGDSIALGKRPLA